MEMVLLYNTFAVCQVEDFSLVNLNNKFVFTSKTDDENSLVCPEELVPNNATKIENGWRAFKIVGILDFSLIGILADISDRLAKAKVGIFVISTYNTDYIFVKNENLDLAKKSLESFYKISCKF